MKDKIFLIWSGNHSIAMKIKQTLECDHSYICYVGGNSDNKSRMFSIGDTVMQQMKACNQAIVLFQKKESGAVSDNLFFELGFALARYGLKKVHCVKRASDAIQLPSDFDNAFVESIDADDDDQYAQKIITYFLHRQKLSVETNKMFLICNRHIIHDMIQAHYSESGSKCSDYELAQYVLFYMQAAVMFQDDAKVLEELRSFKKHHNNEFSTELSQAVNISIALLEVQVNLCSGDDVVYVSDDAFRKYFNSCRDILKETKEDAAGTFDEWARVFITENLAYVCSLYSQNPNLDQNMIQYLIKKTIEYGNECITSISSLEHVDASPDNNDSIGLIAVFRAYIYRHLFLAHRMCGDDDSAKKWLAESLRERKNLLRNFDSNSIDTKIYSNFEMEYYLNLVEYLEFVDHSEIDEFEYVMYLHDIDSFIGKINNSGNIHAYVKKLSTGRAKLESMI